jgi:2-polyprenyl-3-methyl-5-hydroxy-6-metoxy-1,4-benzoquinol methylase
VVWIANEESPLLKDIQDVANLSHILYISDPNLVITNQSLTALLNVCEAVSGFTVPVYNFSEYPAQQSALPFGYDTIATFLEVSDYVSRGNTNINKAVSDYDHGCILAPVELLASSDTNARIDTLIQTSRADIHIAANALVHRFAEYANIPRPELIDLVPDNVSTALDIGCGKGQYGRLLRQARPEIEVTGIEKSQSLADTASAHYKEVIVGDFEHMDFDKQVDLINCGDILEHLQDPWTALKRFCTLLNSGGHLVVSIPNASHWSIVRDLSRGEFEYLPAGLLCIGHLRWFTEKSFKQMLAQSGLVTDKIIRHQPTPSPEGEQLIELLSKMPDHDEQSLRTHTLYIRALKP